MMDQAAPQDEFWRRVFLGKVVPGLGAPGDDLLFLPDESAVRLAVLVPGGRAVFMETWMAGGLGRAQGAYDEMVFRSMVLDDAHFYDPLGLVAEGTEIDFRAGANAYLYGTRFMSYLAYQYSPEALIRWWKRGPGTKRYYADEFREVFGLPLDEAWADWMRWEHEFQQANLADDPQVPDDAVPRHVRPRRWVRSRAPSSIPRRTGSTQPCGTRASCRTSPRISLDDGSSEAAAGNQPADPLPGLLARLRPERAGRSSTPTTTRPPQPDVARRPDRPGRRS